MEPNENRYSFEISLSVLNHLGRNLYRSFATVLGEAISNSWDANAKNVWIYIDKDVHNFTIKDDGEGMSGDDFQNRFLRIGYSKRKDDTVKPPKGRHFIGRKGIGKLALLSCANKIHVISKTKEAEYVGGIIDNSGLDNAITHDMTPDQYLLEMVESDKFAEYTDEHSSGTIIFFEGIKDGIRNSLPFLRKTIALYFRFSLVDPMFNIYINDEKITLNDLKDLAEKTEFLWNINELVDPYIDTLVNLKEHKKIDIDAKYKGFIASVTKPRDLKIITIEERVSVDLFVNGRLRERDILKHIPTSRIVENYLYGQIHFDQLDDEIDRFTSSREGIVADDIEYKNMLEEFKASILQTIVEDWDTWRIKHRSPGDPDNSNIPPKERRAKELFDIVSDEYSLPESSPNKHKVDGWVDELGNDAGYNFSSYADCFISENLIRKFINDKPITLSTEAQRDIDAFKQKEAANKLRGGISINVRKTISDLSYLDMDGLAHLVENASTPDALPQNAKPYKPLRDALMHTALLSDEAKRRLTSVYDNIKARIKVLLT